MNTPRNARPASLPRLVRLRWLVLEHSISRYDDRDKEWDTHTWEDEPVLQYNDGKRWREVPTVKLKSRQPNSVVITNSVEVLTPEMERKDKSNQ